MISLTQHSDTGASLDWYRCIRVLFRVLLSLCPCGADCSSAAVRPDRRLAREDGLVDTEAGIHRDRRGRSCPAEPSTRDIWSVLGDEDVKSCTCASRMSSDELYFGVRLTSRVYGYPRLCCTLVQLRFDSVVGCPFLLDERPL